MAKLTKQHHDDAMRLLAWARRGDIKITEADERALATIAGNWAASFDGDENHLNRLNALVLANANRQPALDMVASDPALRNHRYLTPSMPWAIEASDGAIVATFSAPEAGNEMLTGPADLIGQRFETRDAALRAVSERI